jgi:hypothetical protein
VKVSVTGSAYSGGTAKNVVVAFDAVQLQHTSNLISPELDEFHIAVATER